MIKGCSKKIYHIRNITGKYFDEAYFVLKEGASESDGTATSATLAEEAERIIKEAASAINSSKPRRSAQISRLTAFFTGVFTSSAILGIIAFLISLS